jgi:alpha-glucoside transport system permease protein
MAVTDEVEEQVEPKDEIVRKLAVGEPEQKGTRFTASNILRLLLLIAILAFLGIYVGPGDMISTLLKVVVVVVASAALFVAANLLFDLAYDRWTLFNVIVGAISGFVGYFVLSANGIFRSLIDNRVNLAGQGPYDVNDWLWALIGGGAVALIMFLLSAPRQQLARLPLSTIGFTAFGLLTGFAIDESARPTIDWAQLWTCVVVAAVLLVLISLARRKTAVVPLSALSGVGVGWLIGAWGGGDIGRGNLTGVLLATVVPAAILGVRFGLVPDPGPTRRRRIEQKSRAWIFLLPAMILILAGLVVPLLKTIYISFRNRNAEEYIGLDNYRSIFNDNNSFNLDNWSNFLTSRLFWIAIGMVVVGIIAGIYSGRRTRQSFDRTETSNGALYFGFFLMACAVLASCRGTIFNNLWWVIVVTTLSTALGLGIAVLADRAKGENIAKSLIFLPMAISFVGAAIIWRFMYIARPPTDGQTGVLNSLWVWLGQISNDTFGTLVALILLLLLAGGLGYLIYRGIKDQRAMMAGVATGILLLDLYFIYRFLGPGIGGFTEANGETSPQTILFLQETPFNNMWLMVILIWIQTGFAMVILSSAVKAVPTELTEAARMDGASESQTFWRVVVPQIAPTIGVVVTTLVVIVMKVFDIVKVTTNGNFDTQVIANQMFTSAFGNSDQGLGGALAVILFISVIPIMIINIRRMQKQKV